MLLPDGAEPLVTPAEMFGLDVSEPFITALQADTDPRAARFELATSTPSTPPPG